MLIKFLILARFEITSDPQLNTKQIKSNATAINSYSCNIKYAEETSRGWHEKKNAKNLFKKKT